MIGISGGELARYSIFYQSLLRLQSDATVVQACSANIAQNRNNITEQAIKSGAEYVLYLDDDQVLEPDTLRHLLKHDVDAVSALYLSRDVPFLPNVYNKEKDGWLYRLLKSDDKGLRQVSAVGAGCLLVKTKVFSKMEKPYWRLGQTKSSEWGDDLDFCKRVEEAGFKIWVDLSTSIGHVVLGTIYPRKNKDTWTTELVMGGKPVASWEAVNALEK